MKHITLFPSILLCSAVILSASCSGNSSRSAADVESESISGDLELECDEVFPETQPDVEPADFMSADLRTFGLRGHVMWAQDYYESLSGDERPGEKFDFDKNGKYSPENDEVQVARDENNRISEITYRYDIGGTRYGYGPTGLTASVTEWDTSTSTKVYEEFDIYDNPKSSLHYGEDGPAGTPYGKKTYKYLDWDDQGNWIRRMTDYECFLYPEENETYIERREIIYY